MFLEGFMAKQLLETDPNGAAPKRSFEAPTPPAASASDGIAQTRELARRYLPDAVRLLAGIAFGSDSEAALHTKMLAAKQIIDVAAVVPPTPAAPSFDAPSNGAGSA
jgi:hypothetical protein